MLQGPPGPPGEVGQPGQAGRDGRDGQAPQLTKAFEDALKIQKTSWDTTNLENSFDYFGRTMHEVLKAQQKTTQNLEEQFKRANETQEFQTEAMQDMANANFQMKFDHMFASVPMYDGSNCTIPVPIIVHCINSSELHLQGVALRSQYSDPMPEAVTLQ